jgi:2-polyprenyl-3-methyl-5-hydroxy-6-metoxy-1,4-benzoquinol methylase
MSAPDTLRPWTALEQTGVQEFTYADVPRTDLHVLFGHPPQRVLDIGCASGAVGLGIKKAFPGAFVAGCELDLRAVKIAQTRLDVVYTEPLRQWQATEREILKSMDTVLLLDVLEHMYNPWAELQFLAQNLPPTAQVIVSLPNIGHLSTFSELSKGFWHYQPYGIKDITHLRFFTEYEMWRMFYQTGFKVDQKAYLATPLNLQKFEKYPIRINVNQLMSLQVRDEAHWLQLNAIQLGFRLSIANDDALSAEELKLRHAAHA